MHFHVDRGRNVTGMLIRFSLKPMLRPGDLKKYNQQHQSNINVVVGKRFSMCSTMASLKITCFKDTESTIMNNW
jgi:hypothetical protein